MSSEAGALVFVATGAYSVGKSTTLQWLRDHHGRTIHEEAHPQVVRSLEERSHGHPPDRSFSPVADPSHFCPVCRPREFCDQVVALQRRIEQAASSGDLLERGVYDAVEFYLRHAGAPSSAIEGEAGGRAFIQAEWRPLAPYAKIFMFEVMPELQRPRWGKSVEERVAEARLIEGRLNRIYASRGYEIIRVPPGSVEERARKVLGCITHITGPHAAT